MQAQLQGLAAPSAKDVPSRLWAAPGVIDRTVFEVKKQNDWYEKAGQPWHISKERSGAPHGGSAWKLDNPENVRIATLASDGKVLRWG
ncbi:hypothetical protein [Arsenicicoccus dermatophilus]|uniref:hypothetical protein n=1 Tax=Arsenicicoccus dermatophilus TaxID=1076331 RepID=UPI003916D23F